MIGCFLRIKDRPLKSPTTYVESSLEAQRHDLPDVSSGPNFYNIDGRIKLFNSFFIYGKFVFHCNHLFPTEHPPYVLARTYCVFTVLGRYLSIYVGYFFYFNSTVKILVDLFCYAMVCLVTSCVFSLRGNIVIIFWGSNSILFSINT